MPAAAPWWQLCGLLYADVCAPCALADYGNQGSVTQRVAQQIKLHG